MHFSRQLNCWSLRCSWCIACRRCFNYVFIFHLTLGFNILCKDNCKPRRETFKFWDLVLLILEILRYSCYCCIFHCCIRKGESGLILNLHPANESPYYFVTTSLIGWVQASNQPWDEQNQDSSITDEHSVELWCHKKETPGMKLFIFVKIINLSYPGHELST